MAKRNAFEPEPDLKADNVRRSMEGIDPKVSCAGGRGEVRITRGLSQSCAVCGFGNAGGHCPLLERCDRCASADDPCLATVFINAELNK